MPTYPTALPAPASFPFAGRERRATSPQPGLPQLRGRAREQIVDVRGVRWVYSPAQMAVWVEWYADEIDDGDRWFEVSLPGVGGWVTRMARYVGPVERRHMGAGFFELTADLEINHGRRPPSPHPVLLMHWDGGFVDATGITTFTPEGAGYSFVTGETGFGQAVSATSNGRAAGSSSRDLAIGTQKYTIEGRSKFAEGQLGGYLLGKNYWASQPAPGLFKNDWALGVTPNTIALQWTDQVLAVAGNFTSIYGEWFTWSISDDNETAYFHVNGVLVDTAVSAALGDVPPPVTPGSSISVLNVLQGFSGDNPDWGNSFYQGQCDELRMHIGFALYGPDDYTPATAPFSA